MPTECFHEDDLKNGKILSKRTLYLRVLASHFSRHRENLPDYTVKVDYLTHSIELPYIILRHKTQSSMNIPIRLFVVFPTDIASKVPDIAKIKPSTRCLTITDARRSPLCQSLGESLGISVEEDAPQDPSQPNATSPGTPHIVNAITTINSILVHRTFINTFFLNYPQAKKATILFRMWARQRGLLNQSDSFSGFMFDLILASLATPNICKQFERPSIIDRLCTLDGEQTAPNKSPSELPLPMQIDPKTDAFHLFEIGLTFFAYAPVLSHGYALSSLDSVSAEPAELEQFTPFHSVCVVDVATKCNVASHMTRGAWSELALYARATLDEKRIIEDTEGVIQPQKNEEAPEPDVEGQEEPLPQQDTDNFLPHPLIAKLFLQTPLNVTFPTKPTESGQPQPPISLRTFSERYDYSVFSPETVKLSTILFKLVDLAPSVPSSSDITAETIHPLPDLISELFPAFVVQHFVSAVLAILKSRRISTSKKTQKADTQLPQTPHTDFLVPLLTNGSGVLRLISSFYERLLSLGLGSRATLIRTTIDPFQHPRTKSIAPNKPPVDYDSFDTFEWIESGDTRKPAVPQNIDGSFGLFNDDRKQQHCWIPVSLTTSPFSLSSNSSSPRTSQTIRVGIMMDPIHSSRMVDRGMRLTADLITHPEKKTLFSLLLGEKTERRQFGGEWFECSLWTEEGIRWEDLEGGRGKDDVLFPNRGKRRIEWIVRHILNRWMNSHLDSSSLFFHSNVDTETIDIKEETEELIQKKKRSKAKPVQPTKEPSYPLSSSFLRLSQIIDSAETISTKPLVSSIFGSLSSTITGMETLPLRIALANVIHPSWYGADPHPPLAHPNALAPKVQQLAAPSTPLHKDFSTAAILPKDNLLTSYTPVLLQTERSARWPHTLQAIRLLKTIILVRLGTNLVKGGNGNILVRQHRNYLDLASSGFVFRLYLVPNEELQLMTIESQLATQIAVHAVNGVSALKDNTRSKKHQKNDDTPQQPRFLLPNASKKDVSNAYDSVETAVAHHRELAQTSFVASYLPHHGALMSLYSTHYPAFSQTVCMFKEWLSTNFLSSFVSPQLADLLVAYVFGAPMHGIPPNSAPAAFLRVIHLISSLSFRQQPLVVPHPETGEDDTIRSDNDEQVVLNKSTILKSFNRYTKKQARILECQDALPDTINSSVILYASSPSILIDTLSGVELTPLFIATPTDLSGVRWNRGSPIRFTPSSLKMTIDAAQRSYSSLLNSVNSFVPISKYVTNPLGRIKDMTPGLASASFYQLTPSHLPFDAIIILASALVPSSRPSTLKATLSSLGLSLPNSNRPSVRPFTLLLPPENPDRSKQNQFLHPPKFKNLSSTVKSVTTKGSLPKHKEADPLSGRWKERMSATDLQAQTTLQFRTAQFETLKVGFNASELLIRDLSAEFENNAVFYGQECGNSIGVIFTDEPDGPGKEQAHQQSSHRKTMINSFFIFGQDAVEAVVLF
ncbi:putative U3 small nucleolar RNA-associated protein 22 [Blattamonas nauphoetae]|uniref:U3 small nucleolar RNA-associated protein 22 n=1 Tax=Blattamonas nauphoetae TaxID=2049346 RepID=A0ABQ9XCD3_9EUKA|nr:putative U3 small nucleolar RNA-associated protein 22 [Blattamonas nauphoetae]